MSPTGVQPRGDAAAGLERRVHRVAHEIDQQLLELVGVGGDVTSGPATSDDRQPRLERDDAPHQRHRSRPACASGGGRRARRA